MSMKINRRAAQVGFTLIEVMIATAISGLVMAALIEVFSAQQQMYYRQSAMVRAQANARACLSIVSREVRMAGYTGLPLGLAHLNDPTMGSGVGSIYAVMSLQNNGVNSLTAASAGLIATSKVIAATVGTESGTAPGGETATDAIEIMGNFSRGTTGLKTTIAEGPVATVSIPSSGLRFFNGGDFNRPAFVVVGNNDRTEIFTFVSAPADGGTGGSVELTVTGTSHADYKSNTEIGGEANVVLPIFRRVYYVDTQNIIDATGQHTGALFVANYNAAGALQGNSVELSRDVQEFQVSYNVRTLCSGQVCTVTQDTITDPCAVVGVRMAIRNKGWESADGKSKMNRDLLSVIRIRNSGLGLATCPVL